MGAAQLILFEEVCARRFCCKNGLRLREDALKISHTTDATGSRCTRYPRCSIRRASRSTVIEMADHRRSLRLVGIPSQEFATSITFDTAGEVLAALVRCLGVEKVWCIDVEVYYASPDAYRSHAT